MLQYKYCAKENELLHILLLLVSIYSFSNSNFLNISFIYMYKPRFIYRNTRKIKWTLSGPMTIEFSFVER